jgi:hypothetical protein
MCYVSHLLLDFFPNVFSLACGRSAFLCMLNSLQLMRLVVWSAYRNLLTSLISLKLGPNSPPPPPFKKNEGKNLAQIV